MGSNSLINSDILYKKIVKMCKRKGKLSFYI